MEPAQLLDGFPEPVLGRTRREVVVGNAYRCGLAPAWAIPQVAGTAPGAAPRGPASCAAVLRDDLLTHLRRFPSAPFLFIGAGIGRRYLGLDDWTGLLRRFATIAGNEFDFYSASANGDPSQIATLIAADLHERWWKDDAFAESRALFSGKVHTSESGLKAEVARYIGAARANLTKDELLGEELALLRKVVIDGIITTNYDPLPELLFPEFTRYVGQDELLFADLQGVGETYMIHGSCDEPDSLVLTTADYARFAERNPYLAAKLLTIFVEHPVVFIGYSLSDPNITTILRSIAAVLTNDRISELQDRLLFVQWDPAVSDPVITGTAVVADGFTIPVLSVTVPDFREVYAALGALERKLPARILRQLKEQVYELVRTNDPKGRLFVQDINADVDRDSIDVVFGVGAIAKLTESYKGKGRDDLIRDVLADGELDPHLVLSDVFPTIRGNTHAPIYKYLRGAGKLDASGNLVDGASVDANIANRVTDPVARLQPPSSYQARAKAAAEAAKDFATLAAQHEADDVLMYVGMLPDEAIDAEELRSFLIEHQEDQAVKGHQLQATQWAKGVCRYDWLKYGRG